MEDGLDHGRLARARSAVDAARAPRPSGCARRSGRRGSPKASPLQLAETRERGARRRWSPAAPSKPTLAEQRQLLREVVDDDARRARRGRAGRPRPPSRRRSARTIRWPRARPRTRPRQKNKRELQVKAQVMPLLMQRIDISVASALGPEELRNQIAEIVEEIIVDLKIQLNATELRSIVRLLVDDMVGLGPLEPLLTDETVTDIMVNGPHQVYVERKGKVELTDVVVPRRPARPARRDPHRHRGRPPGRRVDAAGRRPPQGRQPRQHHHPAARHRRADHLDPQVLQEGDHPRRDGAAGQHLAPTWRRC